MTIEDILKQQYDEVLALTRHAEKRIYANTIDETVELRSIMSSLIGKLKVHLDMGGHYLSATRDSDCVPSLPFSRKDIEDLSESLSIYRRKWNGPTLMIENLENFIEDSKQLFSELRLLSNASNDAI